MAGLATGIRWSWLPRTEPLAPRGVVATDAAAFRLCVAALAREDRALARLIGLGAGDPPLLLLLGAAEELPWADGVLYLGRAPTAPALLLPTLLGPSVPVELLERALLRTQPAGSPPLVLLPDPPRLLAAGNARPLHRSSLLRWAARHFPEQPLPMGRDPGSHPGAPEKDLGT